MELSDLINWFCNLLYSQENQIYLKLYSIIGGTVFVVVFFLLVMLDRCEYSWSIPLLLNLPSSSWAHRGKSEVVPSDP